MSPRAAMGAVLTSCAVLACSSSATEAPSGPVEASYTVAFPSEASAVSTDTLQVFVFDAADDASAECLSLAQRRLSGQDLPAAVVHDGPNALCDVVSGAAPGDATAGALSLSFGRYAFLAIAQRRATDLLVGCTLGTVGAANTAFPISLAPVQSVPVLPASCDPNAPLAQHCDRARASQCSP